MVKTVAIVGAGPSGLAAIKACLEEGLSPIAFEMRNKIGGMWNYEEDDTLTSQGRLYKSLITNTSKSFSCFSDFPLPRDAPPFLRHDVYLKYFHSYADNFKLRDYIQYDTKVMKIEQAGDYDITGKWTLYVCQDGGDIVTKTYDFVMICSGNFSEPNIPTIPGRDEFLGEVSHTAQYRDNKPFVDKNVLVVGESFSGLDIAAEISKEAKQVYLCVRDGFWVFQRQGVDGWPYDCSLFRRLHLTHLPTRLMLFIAERFLKSNISYDALGITPKRRVFQSNFGINDALVSQMMCGKVKTTPMMKSFRENGVEFVNGETLDGLDCVVYGTGYKVKTPFIDDGLLSDDLKTRALFKYVFPARLPHPTLACICLFSSDTAIVPVAEMSSRYATRVFKGDITLPPVNEMLADIAEKAAAVQQRWGKDKQLISGLGTSDELAVDVGCYPSLRKLFLTDPMLAFNVLLAPILPVSYRLIGPNKWSGARECLINCWQDSLSGLDGNVKYNTSSNTCWCLLVLLPIIVAVFAVYFSGIL